MTKMEEILRNAFPHGKDFFRGNNALSDRILYIQGIERKCKQAAISVIADYSL